MLKEIIRETELAIDAVYKKMFEEDYLSFILLIGRADVIPGLKHLDRTDCVIDYQRDRYYDETREGFYLRYLNRNYNKEGFHYEGENGMDDLTIEMMIYSHLWESLYFLKSLVRIASILSGEKYIWNPEIPENGKWTFIQNKIIEPLINSGMNLGEIIKKGYSSDIRNAFAHALYNVNKESKTIIIHPKTGIKTISFDDFQTKFLYSVILMNRMQNAQEGNHITFCEANGIITEPFLTPDGIKVQVKAEQIRRGDKSYPEFRMIHFVK